MSQLNLLSTALRLAVTESPSLAISYGYEPMQHLQMLSRKMGENTDFTKPLIEENTEIKQIIKTDWGRNKTKKEPEEERRYRKRPLAQGPRKAP